MNPLRIALPLLLLPGCSIFLDFPGKDAADPADPADPADTADTDDTAAPDTDDPDTDPDDTDTGAPDDTDGPDTGPPDTASPDDTAPDVGPGYDTAWVDTGGEPVSPLCEGGTVAFVVGTGVPYVAVEDALDAALPGDTVQVCPGRHVVAAQLAQDVTLAGYGRRRTFLDGADPGRVLRVEAGASVVVRDLAVVGGSSTSEGGNILSSGAALTLERVLVAAGSAYEGGGVYLLGGTLVVTDSAFEGNAVTSNGGGLLLAAGSATEAFLSGTTFDGNRAGNEGGGIYLDSPASLTIEDGTFTANRADDGGALMAGGNYASTVDIARTTFRGNGATDDGGALAINGRAVTRATIDASVFADNVALRSGGALILDGWSSPEVVATDTTFEGNDAHHGGAFALGGWENPSVRLVDCSVDGNTAYYAAAFYLSGWGVESVVVEGGGVTANVATAWGGAFSLDDESTVTAIDADFGEGAADNLPEDGDGAAFGAGASFTCTATGCTSAP